MLKFLAPHFELELLKRQLEKAEREVTTLRAQLLSEIDSNRTREDGLVDRLLPRGAAPIPRRALLRPAREEPEELEQPAEPVINYDDGLERLIQKRATEYHEQAQAAGHDIDRDFYVMKLRDNPDLLDN
jgi:hypothetical protein